MTRPGRSSSFPRWLRVRALKRTWPGSNTADRRDRLSVPWRARLVSHILRLWGNCPPSGLWGNARCPSSGRPGRLPPSGGSSPGRQRWPSSDGRWDWARRQWRDWRRTGLVTNIILFCFTIFHKHNQGTVDCLLPQVYNQAIKPKYNTFRRFLEPSTSAECINTISIANDGAN